MSRIRVCMQSGAGKHYSKGGATILFGQILNEATVALNDPSGDGKTEAGAPFFGGKERIEEALFDFRRDSSASVLDFKNHHGVGTLQERGAALAGAQGNPPF